MYPYIDFFGNEISTYLLINILSIIINPFILFLIFKKELKIKENIIYYLLFLLIGLLGGKLLYSLENQTFDLYLSTFYINGSLILFSLVGLIIYLFFYKKYSKFFIYSTIGIALFVLESKTACFFAGCCYGVPCENFGYINQALNDGVVRFPIQLIEMFFYFTFLVILILFIELKRFDKYKDLSFPLYLFLYMFSMILFEIGIDNKKDIFGVFSICQIISFACLIYSFIYSFIVLKLDKLNKEVK